MNSYPAKLLLFGEHTVNTGSKALAAPLPMFAGHWQYNPKLDPAELAARQMKLPGFAEYIEQLQQKGELYCSINTALFKQALQKGLTFTSNIPAGYGAGSSGALVAAVFDTWSTESAQWSNGSAMDFSGKITGLRKCLAQLESFFHGTSSGIDPLICFIKKPLLLDGQEVHIADLPAQNDENLQFFLLDTGIERKATPLIEYFLAKTKEEAFDAACKLTYLPAVNEAIGACLRADSYTLFNAMQEISRFQLTHLGRLIPPGFKEIWKEGLEDNLFKLKICGAGGGGFLLGLTKDFDALARRYPHHRLLKISIG